MLEKIPIYELPFKKDENQEFRIYRVQGHTIQNKEYPHKTELPHKHSYHELCFFTDGNGIHEIDFNSYEITSPSIHLVKPGQVHLIRRGENYQGYLIVFSKEFLNLRFQNLEIIPGYPLVTKLEGGPILNLAQAEFIKFFRIIDNIKAELKNTGTETDEIIISYLKIFFLKMKRNFSRLSVSKGNSQGSIQQTVFRFNQLVDTHYSQIHHVKEYAELLGESPVQLNRTIKALTGKTASDLIIERLILEAKRLLLYSALSNKEVAYKLNYEDPSYFSRIFRKKTGYTPSEFRKKIRGDYL
jgi:AraC-like DNA-binding protein